MMKRFSVVALFAVALAYFSPAEAQVVILQGVTTPGQCITVVQNNFVHGSGCSSVGNITIGTTTITTGTSGRSLFDNAGVVGERTVTGSGSDVLATSPTMSAATITGSFTATGLVTNADLANSSVTIAGNVLALGGTLSSATLTASLNLGTSSLQGLVPGSGGGTTNFLRADFTWAPPPGGGGSGCVPAGSNTNLLTDNGSGACTSNAAFKYAGGTATLGTAGSVVGSISLLNATSGSITIAPPTGALGTINQTLQAANDTFVYRATTDTFTNKTYDTGGTGNVLKIAGTTITGISGNTATVASASGAFVSGNGTKTDASHNVVDLGYVPSNVGIGAVNSTASASISPTATNFNQQFPFYTNNAASITYNIPAAAGLVANGGGMLIGSVSANTWTLTPNGTDNLNGANASITVPAHDAALVSSDSTADYANILLGANLASAHLFVGAASGFAADVALSGDATLANTGALTLATVNSNVGTFGDATHCASLTVNGKGLITAASQSTSCPGSGGGSPGGSNTQVQYNNSSAFGGISGVTSNGTLMAFAAGDLTLTGSSSGTSVLNAPATGGGTATLFTGTDTIVGIAATQTLTSKTLTSPTLGGTVAGSPTLSGSYILSANGGLTSGTGPVLQLTGTIVTGGTGTTTSPLVLIQPTGTTPAIGYSTSGTVFAINTPNLFAGNIIDTRNNGGGGLFTVDASGNIFSNGSIALAGSLNTDGGNGARIVSTATDGGLIFRTVAAAALTKLSLGPETSSNVALIPNGTTLRVMDAATSGAIDRPIEAQQLLIGGATPTLTGTCTTGSQTGGNTAGSFTATCTAQTVIITFATAAPHGWFCEANDNTTTTDALRQTDGGATAASCTLTGTTVAADRITFHAVAY